MRIRVEGTCFIESESPIIITPIYQSKSDRTAPDYDMSPATQAERIPPVPKAVKHAKPKRKTKRRSGGHRATCYYCLEGYISHNARRRFCTDAHRHAYMRVMDLHYPLSGADKDRYAELLAKDPVRLAGK